MIDKLTGAALAERVARIGAHRQAIDDAARQRVHAHYAKPVTPTTEKPAPPGQQEATP